jgi:HEAT repeat protein
MSHLSSEAVVRILEEHGAEGRRRLEKTDIPDKGILLGNALERAESPLVRQVICNMLASLADAASLPHLLVALDDPDSGVVAAAADAIGNTAYDQPIEESLRQRLGARLLALAGTERTVAVRSAAVYGLGLMRFAAASPFLVQALNDAAPAMRWGAAEALAHIGDPQVAPLLRARLDKESHQRVIAYINSALAELTEHS